MTVNYYPFNTGAGANSMQDRWGNIMKAVRTNGIIPAWPNPTIDGYLQVIANTGLSTQVKPGNAWIEGFYLENTANFTLSHNTADPTNPRIDYVIARLDRVNATITLMVLTGTPAATPSAPTLTQTTTGIYDLPLAQVTINANATTISSSNITDSRDPSFSAGFVPSAKIFKGTNYSVPNATYVAFPFDTLIYDNCNLWNNANPTRLTIPYDGIYTMQMGISWSGNVTGTRISQIRRNGTSVLCEDQWQPSVASTNSVTTTVTAKLARGDYIEAYVYQSSGGLLAAQTNGPSTYPFLVVTFLGL